jgi:F0F1-type ATP synthase epsilon subunit
LVLYTSTFFSFHLLFVLHYNDLQDISCPEAVKVDDIDSAAVTSAFEKAKAAFSTAEAGSRGAAEAQIDMEVYKSMAGAVGVTLA